MNTARAQKLRDEVDRHAPWYHTFELSDDIVTDGVFDLRRVAERLPIPTTLKGSRCLDVAACEGFWSFELSRRGADEVVSVDLPDASQQDWLGEPDDEVRASGSGLANEHFSFMKNQFGAKNVTRVDMNVYDLDPDEVGLFDFVFVGNILIHLADPVRALRAIRTVMRADAELVSLEINSLVWTLLSPRIPVGQLWDLDEPARWWTPNRAAHRRFVEGAGFEVIQHGRPLLQHLGNGWPKWPGRFPRKARELLFWTTVRQVGAPSGWIRAKSPA